MDELFKNKKVVQVVIMLLFAATLYLVGLMLNNFKLNGFIGRDVPALTTISVSGEGEAFAKPDTTEFSFSVSQDAKTVASAQKITTEKTNDIIAYMKKMKVEDKDITTTDYSVNPKYEYQKAVACLDNNMNGYCPEGKQILVGYTVSQSVDVKIHKIDDVGAILTAIGEKGATNVSGLSFTVDQKKTYEAKARDNAIQEAQAKAETIADSLKVTLTRVTSFSEDGNASIYPMAKSMTNNADFAMAPASAPAPTISTGENKFTSNVTITYEIQ